WPVGVAATASWSGWRRLRVNAGRQVTVGQGLPRRGLPPLDRSATLLQTVIQKGASGEEDAMLMWVLIAVLVTATTVVLAVIWPVGSARRDRMADRFARRADLELPAQLAAVVGQRLVRRGRLSVAAAGVAVGGRLVAPARIARLPQGPARGPGRLRGALRWRLRDPPGQPGGRSARRPGDRPRPPGPSPPPHRAPARSPHRRLRDPAGAVAG